jgi:hypothetical protein
VSATRGKVGERRRIEQPGQKRRDRRLAVGAADGRHAPPGEEVLAQELRQRAVREPAVEQRLDLGVAAREGVADDRQVGRRLEVLRAVAFDDRESLSAQEVAHRREDAGVRTGHGEPRIGATRRGGHSVPPMPMKWTRLHIPMSPGLPRAVVAVNGRADIMRHRPAPA